MSQHPSKFTLDVLSLEEVGTDIGPDAQQRMLEAMSRHYDTIVREQRTRHEREFPELRTDVARVYPRLIWLAQQEADVGINYGEFNDAMAGPADSRGVYVGHVVGTVSRIEAKEARPALSTLVVNKRLGYPREGHQHYTMLSHVGQASVPETAEDHARWQAEYDHVKAEWQPTRP